MSPWTLTLIDAFARKVYVMLLAYALSLASPFSVNAAEDDLFYSILAQNQGLIEVYNCRINTVVEKLDEYCSESCEARVQTLVESRGESFLFLGFTTSDSDPGESVTSYGQITTMKRNDFVTGTHSYVAQIRSARDGRILELRGRKLNAEGSLMNATDSGHFYCRGITPRTIGLGRRR